MLKKMNWIFAVLTGAVIFASSARASTESGCWNGPAGPVCECQLSFPKDCKGDTSTPNLPCSVDGAVLAKAGYCPAGTIVVGSGASAHRNIQIEPSIGTWKCGPPHKTKITTSGSLEVCQNSIGNPFCVCTKQFSEGCGATGEKNPVESDPSVESCWLGDSTQPDLTCPSGSGTGKALWKCSSLDPKQQLKTCTCKLELRTIDVCNQCSVGKSDTAAGNQCSLLSNDEMISLEESTNCVLNGATQQATVKCPEGTPRAGEPTPFIGRWSCTESQ